MDMTTTPLDPTPPQLKLDNQLCFALYSASLSMTKQYRPLLQKIGLTYPQYLVMLVLWEGDDLRVSTLGDRLYLDSGTLTPLLKRLEAAGLVERRRSTEDEREVRVRLTSAGRALRAKAEGIPQILLCATGCELPEVVTLTQTLQRLRRSINEFSEE
jgi:DNA-binding MarR family transcriptional regulator